MLTASIPAPRGADASTASRSVAWWPVHSFVSALVAQANTSPPVAGTPAWRALADDDPAKLLALAVAGEHHVLRTEIAQEHRAEASKAVAASTDWRQVGRELHQLDAARRSGTRIERRRAS